MWMRTLLACVGLVVVAFVGGPGSAASPGGPPEPIEVAPGPPAEEDPDEDWESLKESDPPIVNLDPDPDASDADKYNPDDDPDEMSTRGRAARPTLPYIDRGLLAPRQSGAGRGSAQIGLASVGEDFFLELDLRLRFYLDDAKMWRIAPRLPLRVRLVDEAPETGDVIRTEDWDEPSDWARLLQYVQYGRVGDPIFFRYGELNGATIGHGSLVNRYSNTIDLDHYQGGINTQLDFGLIGGEMLLDNVFDPEVLVGRVYARPFFGLKRAATPLRLMKFAFTAGADFYAPLEIGATGGGKLFSHPDWSPVVLADEVASLFAFDLEVPVLNSKALDIVPYTDLATVDGAGFGWHLGTYIILRASKAVTWTNRLEYRLLGKGYEPGYVSPFYEVERFAYRGGETKLKSLKSGQIADKHNGFYFETDLRLRPYVRFALLYSTSGRERGHDLLLRLRLTELGPLAVTVFYARLGFDGLDNLHAADQTVWGTTARLNIAELFFVRAGVTSEWWLKHKANGGSGFETTVNFDIGAGVIIKL
ncbi:MAG: hypothetical protein ACI9MR_001332 [Myxococcota bacterium]|jgi:hypothetical protein